ncbi:group-specific protein [Gracilibacillus oryzae]|uniref:Group-specific protein n=1 Tax=Gracilibacillus oryzae TaxID=1672701 RepID=A0A7C8L0H2_9BACI|nr:group-specific protein [Gracilibacillus oryzae]KAB8138086.1 group-specific protein [Gracilibacillus oryzae]
MYKFYIASGFKNIENVRHVSDKLKDAGFIQTYDWTQNQRATTIEDLKEIGTLEKNAVMEADFFIILLPAGKSSHIELGMALGLGKRIYLYSENAEYNHFETTSTFYHLPEVNRYNGSIDGLVATLKRNAGL